MFIPGNPGLVDYYVTYTDLISKKYPEYDILVVSHVGFQTSDDYVNLGRLKLHPDFYNLNDQIQHKVQILKQRVLQGQHTLSFLSHSIGSYITQRDIKTLRERACAALDEDRVRRLYMPNHLRHCAVCVGSGFYNVIQLSPCYHYGYFLFTLLKFLLPDSWARSLIRKYALDPPSLRDAILIHAHKNAVDATFRIFKSARIARQALCLAREELNVIHRDDSLNDWFLRSFRVVE